MIELGETNLPIVSLTKRLRLINEVTFRICSRCGETETVPHAWVMTTTPATCQAEGETKSVCSDCGAVRSSVIPISDHIPAETIYENETPATCTDTGQRDAVMYCRYCSMELYRTQESIPALGHSFTNYVFNHDATVDKDGTKTAKCDRCNATDTIPAPGTKIRSTVSIHNFSVNKTVDYRTTIIFSADVKDPVPGAQVHWFINNQDKGTGETYTVRETTQNFTVQAKYIDESGSVLAESETETVKVNVGFFARMIAFFRALFGRLPKLTQEYLGVSLADPVKPYHG